MFTYLGKFLVLLNAFVAVAVLAFAASAYVTRLDPAEAVDASGMKLTDKLKKADGLAATAQKGYAPELARVADAEAALFDLRKKIDARFAEAKGDKLFNIYDSNNSVLWDSPKERQLTAPGLEARALKGVDTLAKDLTDLRDAASVSIGKIDAAAVKLLALNTEVADLNAQWKWLDRIGKQSDKELAILEDLRVNWEGRGGSLTRRRNQLQARLESLTADPPAKVQNPAPPPAPFTLGR